MSADPEVEAALASERLGRLEQRVEEAVTLARSSDSKLARLVELGEHREAREIAALEIERKRRDASEEAETKRLEAELAERAERGRWWRSTAAPPLLASLAGLLTAAGTALGTWAAGLWGGER